MPRGRVPKVTMSDLEVDREALTLAHIELMRLEELIKGIQRDGEWDDWLAQVRETRKKVRANLRQYNNVFGNGRMPNWMKEQEQEDASV